MRKSTTGFTLVELLIVIVVIAILAAITIVAYNGIQSRAKASRIESMYGTTKKAFRLVTIDQGLSVWPLDNSITGTNNPSLQSIAETTEFKDYMSPGSYSNESWNYDNDGNTYDGCSVGGAGAAIFTKDVSKSVAQQVDDDIDDGNLSCGSVTYNTGNNGFRMYLPDSV